MTFASSYIIFPLPDYDWAIKMPSISRFGSSVDIGAAYVNKTIRVTEDQILLIVRFMIGLDWL